MRRLWGPCLLLVALVLAACTGGAARPSGPYSLDADPAGLLVATATASPSVAEGIPDPAPDTVFLNGSAEGGSPPYRYAWAFGDGANGTGPTVIHAYVLPGTYVAVLTVTDQADRVATSTVAISPTPGDPRHAVWPRSNVSLGPVPLSVHFAAYGSSDSPTSFAWAFGDGASTHAAEANHTYVRPGTYVARVNATDSDGVQATSLVTVIATYQGLPRVLATVTVVGLCDSDVWNRADFQAQVGGGTPPYTYAWAFGDRNATATSQAPSYSYDEYGLHVANVTVVDSAERVATSSVALMPVPPPCAAYSVAPWFGLGLAVSLAGALLATVYVTAQRRRKRLP